MKPTFTILTLILFILPGAFNNPVQAQVYDQVPSVPLKGEWYAPQQHQDNDVARATDPFIVSCISQVNADSMRATLQHLQDFGTRFMLVDNRKEVAEWLLGRFESFGYTDVRLDSFLNILNWGGGTYVDTTWQYNVICTLSGVSAPGELYRIGGHYDSYCSGDPYVYAPGVNDNGSAVAATIEIARIMALADYHPQATIQFTLYAAEELGLWGSRYQASKASNETEDVRYYLNMDMISNNPDSSAEVKIYHYLGCEWAGALMSDAFARYTTLEVFIPADLMASGSDSYSYWIFGFPTAYLEEYHFSPNWHKPGDVLANCNVEYCAEIARGAMATLMEQQILPYPLGTVAHSSAEGVTISWDVQLNALITGANIYRSESIHNGFSRINIAPVADSFYLDASVPAGKQYYYKIAFTNDSLQEGFFSNTVCGARFGFTDTLLVVACLKGSKTTPDSVVNFYHAVFDTIPYRWVDVNSDNPLDLGYLAKSKNILWLMNEVEFNQPDDTLGNKLISFLDNGGNIMVAGFTPSRYFANNSSYPFKFTDIYFINRYFKVDSVNRKVGSFMYRAYPDAGGYDTLRVDPLKWMEEDYPGEIYNIEVFTPAEGGQSIYRFDSHYPPTSGLGAMQGKTVGLESMEGPNKTIMLSFPLWYLDTSDARGLMKYVMTEKFNHPIGIEENTGVSGLTLFQNYPNPFSETTTVSFSLDVPSPVNITVCSMQGVVITTLFNGNMGKGSHMLKFSSGNLPTGVYQLCLKSGIGMAVRKMIIIR